MNTVVLNVLRVLAGFTTCFLLCLNWWLNLELPNDVWYGLAAICLFLLLIPDSHNRSVEASKAHNAAFDAAWQEAVADSASPCADDENVSSFDPDNPSYEYLRVEVRRSESTDLYLKVPKGWRPKWQYANIIKEATLKTVLSDDDWDSYGWENNLETQGHKVVDEDEAQDYAVFDVVAFLSKPDSAKESG
jgi:hypothetical protein